MWDDLPADSTNFSTLNSFKRSLTPSFLAKHCGLFLLDLHVVTNCRF